MTDTVKEASVMAATTTGSDAVAPPSCGGSDASEGVQNSSAGPGGHDAPNGGGPGNNNGTSHLRQRRRMRDRFGYLATREFGLVLLIGQLLALCLTGTNTLTTLLVMQGTSIPAFQTFFNYVLLNLIYTSYTVYRYGVKGWARLIWKDGWKCEFSASFLLG